MRDSGNTSNAQLLLLGLEILNIVLSNCFPSIVAIKKTFIIYSEPPLNVKRDGMTRTGMYMESPALTVYICFVELRTFQSFGQLTSM